MAYLTGEARAQLDAFKAVMVKHARLQEVDQALSLAIEEHADSTHVLLCGPGGVGKSTVLKGVTERFTREEVNRVIVPIVYLEPIPSDSGPYVRLDYYRQIVTALKGHILAKEIFVNVAHLMAAPKASRTRTGITDWLDMREAAEQALVRSQVKAVLIDEGHRLMQGSGQYTTDEQLEWLKSLTTRTNVLHVLAGPYELFPFRNTSGQLVRRGRDLHFARYHVEEPEERKAFVAAVKYLLERVPLTCDLDALLARWRWFADGCVGCIGIVKTWLVDAVAATLAQGGTHLTEEMLIRTMLHPAKRVSLEMEARAGEHRVEIHNSESAKQLQVLQSHPEKAGSMPRLPQVTQTAQASEKTVPSLPLPQVSPKPTKTRVGERGPGRDLVGEASAVAGQKATGCIFSEVIAMKPSQMEEAKVSHVECPVCLAVRDIHPKGDRVRFPWHPKRVTSTPNHSLRWVRRGDVWELSGKSM
jgi:DNA polymerase III delta prime subunit